MPGDNPIIRLGVGAAAALSLPIALFLFFGLGSFLNWMIP